MIHRFRVENYKALRNVTLDLTPIHVLIGPNDSGKTSILEALAALGRSVDHSLSEAFTGAWKGARLVWGRDSQLPVSLTAGITLGSTTLEYRCDVRFSPDTSRKHVVLDREYSRCPPDTEPQELGQRHWDTTGVSLIVQQGRDATVGQRDLAFAVSDALRDVHYYHWDPHVLALPVASDSHRRFRMEATGFGLAQCLDDILGDDRSRFDGLERRFQQIFPQVQSIKLVAEPAFKSPADDPEQIPILSRSEGKGIYFKFAGTDEPVAASQVSDGMLLVLAFLTILHLPRPPRLVLIEEPENGIHPSRLRDILTILRELAQEQSRSQVILTTHSPYVVDLFKPQEVTMCRKTGAGDIEVTRLSDSRRVRDQIDVFTLGEIWSAEDEALMQPIGDPGGDAT